MQCVGQKLNFVFNNIIIYNNLFYIASVYITCAQNRCTWNKK